MPPRPLWLAEDPGETEVGCGINQGQVPALVVAPSRAPRLLLARLQARPVRSELGAALARCSADISFNVLWLRCASAQSTRVRLGALAGEYGGMAVMHSSSRELRRTPARLASLAIVQNVVSRACLGRSNSGLKQKNLPEAGLSVVQSVMSCNWN